MLKNLILASAVVLFAIVLTFGLNAYFKSERGDFFILEAGKAIPDFSFQTMDGKNHSYYDFTDNPTIIHFWATWCAPCVVEFPELIEFAEANPNVTILAISSDRNVEAINRFLSQNTPNMPENVLIIHDGDNAITRDKFSVFALPESFIADEQGLLKSHIIGAYKNWAELSL